jgi:hypothetical protein
VIRVVCGVVGVAAVGYGGWLLLRRGWDEVAAAGTWLAGGVLVHDGLLAPLVVGAALLGLRFLPPRWRGPVAGGLVVLGSVTLMAVPVLGRFGSRPDNPTLLDRNYVAGWGLIAALTALGVVLAAYHHHRDRTGGPRGR